MSISTPFNVLRSVLLHPVAVPERIATAVMHACPADGEATLDLNEFYLALMVQLDKAIPNLAGSVDAIRKVCVATMPRYPHGVLFRSSLERLVSFCADLVAENAPSVAEPVPVAIADAVKVGEAIASEIAAAPAPAPVIAQLGLNAALAANAEKLLASLSVGFEVFRKSGNYLLNEGLAPLDVANALVHSGVLRIFGGVLYYFNQLRWQPLEVDASDILTTVAVSACSLVADKVKAAADECLPAWEAYARETHTGTDAALDKKLAKIADTPVAAYLYFRSPKFIRELAGVLRGAVDLHASAADLDGLGSINKLLTPNGVVDCVSGELLAPRPSYNLSKVAGVAYDPTAKAPRFESFLLEIFPDAETVRYVQTVLGSYLRGRYDRLEGALILQGAQGAGGKSVFLTTILEAFGGYGNLVTQKLAGMFIDPPNSAARSSDPSAHDSATASFHGYRFAFVDELAEGSSFNEVGFKSITGRGEGGAATEITARAAYKSTPIRFSWMAGLAFATNSPIRAGHQAAILRRMRSVECHSIAVTPEEFEQRKASAPAGTRIVLRDGALKSKLKAELPGILAWLVEGSKRDAALEALGLAVPTPAAVLAAGNVTQRQEGTLDHFASLYLRPLAENEAPQNALAAADFGALLQAYFADLSLSAPAWIFAKDGKLNPGFYTKLGTTMGFQSGVQTSSVRGSASSMVRRLVSKNGAGVREGIAYTDAAAELFGLPKVGSVEFIKANGLVSSYLANARYASK